MVDRDLKMLTMVVILPQKKRPLVEGSIISFFNT